MEQQQAIATQKPQEQSRRGQGPRFGRGFGKGRRSERNEEKPRYDRILISSRRVAKVRKGDKLLSFSTLIAVGDKKGKVAVEIASGADVRSAMNKAANAAERKLFKVPMVGTTIPHDVMCRYGAAKVLLRSAPVGTGVIAGGAIRSVLEAAGIKDIVAKQISKGNAINNAYCTFKALKMLKSGRFDSNEPHSKAVVTSVNPKEMSYSEVEKIKSAVKPANKPLKSTKGK